MTRSSSDGATRRRKYTEQYRKDAVELWRTSGRTAAEIARQLGIKRDRLYVWASEVRPPGGEMARPRRSPAQLHRENAARRDEIDRLRKHRNTLKKSRGIVSEPPLR